MVGVALHFIYAPSPWKCNFASYRGWDGQIYLTQCKLTTRKNTKLLILQVTFLTFGTEDIHQIHEIIEYHIFIWNCRSFEHNKHSVSSFSYQFSFSTLTELAQTNVTTKLLSKAAISNEYMIFYHFMILVDIIHSKRQKSYLYTPFGPIY